MSAPRYTEYSTLTLAGSSSVALAEDTIMWRDETGFDDPSSFMRMTFETLRSIIVLPLFGAGVTTFLLTPNVTTLGNLVSSSFATLSGNLYTQPQSAPNFVVGHTTVAYVSVSPITLDFGTQGFKTCLLSGGAVFETSNRAACKSLTVRVSANSATCALSFPAWTFVGAAAPTSIAAYKQAILTLTAFGTSESDVTATYAVQP